MRRRFPLIAAHASMCGSGFSCGSGSSRDASVGAASAAILNVIYMRLTGPDTLEIVTMVHDREALTKPWTTTRVYGRHRDLTRDKQ